MKFSRTILFRFIGHMAFALVMATAQNVNASVIYYVTPAGSSTSGGLVDASALFTINNNWLSIALSNLFQNPTSDAQEISGITFSVSGASGSGILTTVNSGNISTINIVTGKNKATSGSYTTGVADSLTNWIATETGTTISLTDITGGQPNKLIIGPDNLGNLNPGLGGRYSNANSSIGQHNPNVLGSATFNIYIPGITSTSILSDVIFQFGTDATTNHVIGLDPPPPGTVPEPASLALIGIGLAGFGFIKRKRH